jgi:hypothetical protein
VKKDEIALPSTSHHEEISSDNEILFDGNVPIVRPNKRKPEPSCDTKAKLQRQIVSSTAELNLKIDTLNGNFEVSNELKRRALALKGQELIDKQSRHREKMEVMERNNALLQSILSSKSAHN